MNTVDHTATPKAANTSLNPTQMSTPTAINDQTAIAANATLNDVTVNATLNDVTVNATPNDKVNTPAVPTKANNTSTAIPNITTLSQIQFDVDLSIYTQEALNYTCYDYAGRFYIEQTKNPNPALINDNTTADNTTTTDNSTIVHVTLLLKDATTAMSVTEATQIRHEFNQSLLDYQTRIDLEKHFGHIRDLLVAEAFKPINS